MKKNLLSLIWNFIFPNNRPEKRMIISIVNGLKKLVESDEAADFVKMTEFTDLDDKALTWLRRTLPTVLDALSLSNGSINIDKAVQESVSFLKVINKKDRTPLWQQLAGKLYASRSGKQESVAIIEINQEYSLLS